MNKANKKASNREEKTKEKRSEDKSVCVYVRVETITQLPEPSSIRLSTLKHRAALT